MKKSIYVFTSGELKREGNTLCLISEEKKRFIPITNVGEIHIFGEATLNKRFLEFISSEGIPIHFYNYYGFYTGSFYPREFYNSGYLVLKQAEHYLDLRRRLSIASKFVRGALDNIQTVLQYYHRRGKDLKTQIMTLEDLKSKLGNVRNIEELMAIEGNAKKEYYSAFNSILDSEEYRFEQRTKRPPKTMIDSLLSFGNSVLYTTCLSEIYRTHLDPRIGFLHETNFRRFSLNLDVAEVFKQPIVDRVIFTLVNKKILNESHFIEELGGVFLNEKGRKIFIEEYEKKLSSTSMDKSLKRNVSYRGLIRMDLYKIEKHLIEEKEYEPFALRW